jgi:hypothetical protein
MQMIWRNEVIRKTKHRNVEEPCHCMFCGGDGRQDDELEIVQIFGPGDAWFGHARCYDAFLAEMDAAKSLEMAIKTLKSQLRRLGQSRPYRSKALGKYTTTHRK